jgi:hypothetical protein
MGTQIGTFTPDKLISDVRIKPVTKKVTVLSGQNLVRGTVIGLVTVGALSETHAGNTGTGAMSGLAAGKKTVPGAYTVRCDKVVANAGDFTIIAPNGNVVGIAHVGVAFVSDHLNFTIADATDFILGDTFVVTVAAGSGKAVIVNSANIDGSGAPEGVMLENVDASSGDLDGIYAITGEYNEDALVFGGSDTKETHRAALRDMSIFLHTHKGVAQ